MKKSNIILIALLGTLYIMPVIVWGICKISSAGDYYTGFDENIRFLRIENVGLTKEDVIINTDRVSGFRGVQVNNINVGDSYLYYKGNRRYLPKLTKEDDVLITGKAVDAPSGEKLKLHVRIKGLYEITLNGETIWRR
jgi:hypothetical protein